MSLNQLPEELVAKMASYLNFTDIVNLLQTQRRVNKMLKREKLDRTAIALLTVFNRPVYENDFLVGLVTRTKNGPQIVLERKDLPLEGENVIIDAVSKFSSISWLEIVGADVLLNDEFVQMLKATKTEIRKITFISTKVHLSPHNFVQFCKRFKEISITDVKEPSGFIFSDEVIVAIVSSTKIEFRPISTFNTAIPLDISDLSLEAIAAGESSSAFQLSKSLTLITVKGVRQFVERTLGVERARSMDLGVLRNSEEENALNWLAEANNNTFLPYKIIMNGNNGERQFSVLLKSASSGNNIIYFDVKTL